jgi:hypothetical protein
MTTSIPATSYTEPAPAERLERAASALTAKNFAVEILPDAAAARGRVQDLSPDGASVFTAASETLRLSGIEDIAGAQKVVPNLEAALRRVEEHCLPLENERATGVYGGPSASNRVLILNAEPHPPRHRAAAAGGDRVLTSPIGGHGRAAPTPVVAQISSMICGQSSCGRSCPIPG